MHPISIAHLTVLEASPPEMVSFAAACGYDTVGLRIRLDPRWPNETQYPMIGGTPMLKETLRRMADTGVKVLDIEVVRLMPNTRPPELVPMFECGVELGAKFVLVLCNDPDEARATANFAAVAERAGALGLISCLEFFVMSEVKSIEQAVRIVKAAAQPRTGVLIDALHLFRSGGSVAALKRYDPALFPYIQFCDAPLRPPEGAGALQHEARSARLYPGEGGLPLRELLAALPDDIALSLEAPKDAFAKTMTAAGRAKLAIDATRAFLKTL
ncbi:MAG: sugar phosphate isomerase/epimerase [Alphaproteobacteria bacterium]|nr:sugar phosphate isomerase/epimerase [Alphaproteobacteria bacterium]